MPDTSHDAGREDMPGRDDLPIRDELRGLTPYGAPQVPAAIRLNTNENPYPMPDDVATAIEKAVAAQVTTLNRYPDRDATALREDLAAYLNGDALARGEGATPTGADRHGRASRHGHAAGHAEAFQHDEASGSAGTGRAGVAAGYGLTAAHIWAANGSNETQQQILQTFGGPGRVAMGFAPSYSMHRLLALGAATGWIDGARDGDFRLSPQSAAAQVRAHRPDLVFICAPNNPTGTALPPDVLDSILEEAPGIVVADEAYAEFRRDGVPSALRLLPDRPRLIVTRTMSKAFACAGVRLGYLAAAPAVVEAVQLVRLPYHLSSLTQAAARAALAHAPRLLATVDALRRDRDRLVSDLRARGLTVADSDANFVLFGGFGGHAPEMWRRLCDHGVLIRDVGLPGWLRVTVGASGENAAFLRALDAALDDVSGGAPGGVG